MSEKVKTIITSIIFFSLGCICAGAISYKYRSELNNVRTELTETQTQLDIATELNTEIKQQLDRTRESLKRERDVLDRTRKSIDELGQTTESSIATIDDCIRLVREIREKVKALEDSIYDWNSNYSSSLHNNNGCNL